MICIPKVGLNNQLIKVQIFMTKYNKIFKQQVVSFYFEYHENLPLTLRYFNLLSKTVRCWIIQYKYLGIHGLAVLYSKILSSNSMWLNLSLLAKNGIQQSMSRKENCLDNGAMESFFGRMKTECFYGKTFENIDEP